MTELNNLLENIQNIKINIGNAIENKGQTITNFASYPNAILNIKAAEGDVLLFSNLSEMNNYTNMNEGDLALVYDINTSNLQALWQYTNNSWGLAPVGLTANKEYVNSAKFWGANGVETGTLQVNSNLTAEQVKIKAQVYSDLSYLELDPSVNSLYQAFYVRPDLKTVPNFNTSNVVNMKQTFYRCSNLTNIPNFDTSNVTDMCGIFYICTNLVNAPALNTSNVTYMSRMFSNCHNLTNIANISNYDTSKVVLVDYMFHECNSLVDAPDLNTSNVTNMSSMFNNCTNLVNVPQYNTSKVNAYRGCSNMFFLCNNLSNASIQNIINMCLNVNITNTMYKNLSNSNQYSPLYHTIFDSTYYSNRLDELTAAGWKY